MKAYLVCDGGRVSIPPVMGTPSSGQMVGTDAEQLTELCGRLCYDSLGSPKSRNSGKYFQHIIEVGHLSVCEHFRFTVHFRTISPYSLGAFVNRPGVYVTMDEFENVRVTANLRSVLEWRLWTKRTSSYLLKCFRGTIEYAGGALAYHANKLAPQIVPKELAIPEGVTSYDAGVYYASTAVVQPEDDHERFISMYLRGSRGFSHEQVRHRKSMSQRSTRYCDETDTEWISHPLADLYMQQTQDEKLELVESEMIARMRNLYKVKTDKLEAFLLARGVDKLTARKQARGAARGVLGNALATEMIFTDSVWGWRNMLSQRASAPADAEIRAIYGDVIPLLKASRYADRFEDVSLQPSPDGIGMVAVWKGNDDAR